MRACGVTWIMSCRWKVRLLKHCTFLAICPHILHYTAQMLIFYLPQIWANTKNNTDVNDKYLSCHTGNTACLLPVETHSVAKQKLQLAHCSVIRAGRITKVKYFLAEHSDAPRKWIVCRSKYQWLEVFGLATCRWTQTRRHMEIWYW
jgi:hypothetical protein